MKNTFKLFAFLFIGFILFFNSSCLTDEEKEPRTYETERLEIESLLITLEEEGYDIDTTELGIYYSIDEMGEGPNPEAGDTIFVEYTGAFVNGTIFDASVDHWQDGIWEFNYLEQSLIAGFNDALSVMQKGTKLDAIIPSEFGYGPYGYSDIPPYTTLVFSLKLHDIKPKTTD